MSRVFSVSRIDGPAETPPPLSAVYRGNGVLNGARAPLAADGQDGDFWIDTVAFLFYGPKAGGVWPTGVAIGAGTGGTGGTGGGGTGGAPTLDATLSTPTLIDKTSGGVLAFDGSLGPDYAPGDTIYLVAKNKAGAIVLTLSHTINLAEATDTSAGTTGKATFTGLAAVSLSSTYRWTTYVLKAGGATYGPSSNIVITGPDDIAPVLSNPTKASVSATSATVGVDTDTGEGQLWLVIPANGIQPTNTQIKAGQDSTGAAAVFAATFNPVTAAGTKNVNVTGLTVGNAYTPYWLHRDAAGNEAVLPGLAFTTVATSTWQAASGVTLTNGNLTANVNDGGVHDVYGSVARSSGTGTITMTCDYPAGYLLDPGLVDSGTGIKMLAKADASGAWGAGWNAANPRHAVLVFDLNFTTRTVALTINGVSAGSAAMPATGFVNVRPYVQLGYGTQPTVTLDTSNFG